MAQRGEKSFAECGGTEQKFPTHSSGGAGSPRALDVAAALLLLLPGQVKSPDSALPGPGRRSPPLSAHRQARRFGKSRVQSPGDAQHCVEQGREAGGASHEKLGAFLLPASPGLSSSSWEIFP